MHAHPSLFHIEKFADYLYFLGFLLDSQSLWLWKSFITPFIDLTISFLLTFLFFALFIRLLVRVKMKWILNIHKRSIVQANFISKSPCCILKLYYSFFQFPNNGLLFIDCLLCRDDNIAIC